MATGLRRFALVMGGVAKSTAAANKELARNEAIVRGIGGAPSAEPGVVARPGAFSKIAEEVTKAVDTVRDGADEIKRAGDETAILVTDTLRRVQQFHADATATFKATERKAEGHKIEVTKLTYEVFRTLNATEFNIEDFVTNQREAIRKLRQEGAAFGLGEYLDAYASIYEKTRRGQNVSPQLSVELERALTEIRRLVTTLGGAIGRNFNFDQLQRDIDQRARANRGNERSTGTAGGGSGSGNTCGGGPSLAILQGSGALR